MAGALLALGSFRHDGPPRIAVAAMAWPDFPRLATPKDRRAAFSGDFLLQRCQDWRLAPYTIDRHSPANGGENHESNSKGDRPDVHPGTTLSPAHNPLNPCRISNVPAPDYRRVFLPDTQ